MQIPKFVGASEELDRFRCRLKIVPCPRCSLVGSLNCHGFLRGNSETGLGDEKIFRARRFFCSNRQRRRGCGGTFSVHLAGILPRFTVSAATLWRLIDGLREGLSTTAAWSRIQSPFSVNTGYRLARTVHHGQSRIRTALSRQVAPPPSNGEFPLQQMIAHLDRVFPEAACLVEAFQQSFQKPFLGESSKIRRPEFPPHATFGEVRSGGDNTRRHYPP